MNRDAEIRQITRENRRRRIERMDPPPCALERDRPLAVSDLPVSGPRPQRVLRVETHYFCAGSLWEKIGGTWSCVQAAPILRWMIGKTPDTVKLALLKMGARYEFLSPTVMGKSHGTTA